MAELDPECHSGAVSFGQQFPPADWFSISQHLDTEESFEDYAKFRSSLMHIYTSLTMSIISENEVPFGWFSGEEQKLLERYRFDAYVQSSGRIRCDTNVSAILRGMVQGFSPPMTTQGTILHAYHRHLKELHYKHQFFACRKGLAKCDFIKCDSDFDEIFQRLKSEKKWPQLHESVIRIALDQHFSLLRMLNDDNLAMMGCVSVGNITEGDKLLEAINKEYAKELCDLTKSFQELRKIYYFKHLEFKILQHRLADQAVASRTACIPKRPDPYFQYYYGKFAYLPFHERMRLKWKDGKNLLQQRLPQVKMVRLGLAVVGSAFMLGSASATWMLVGTEKERKTEH